MPSPDQIGHDPERVLSELVAARILDSTRAQSVLTEFHAEQSVEGDPVGIVDFLVQHGLLTPFQAERVEAGEAAKLIIGSYLLLEPTSQGAWGTVYQALNRTDRQRFAIRVLPLRSLWKVLRTKDQLAAMATVPPHPVVVPFADVGSADGRHYLAWPFVDGETLEHSVQRVNPLSPTEAARLFADLADGLAACQTVGVSHGCIQPSVILLGTDRRPHLTELGFGALLAENMTGEESMLDTVSTSAVMAGMLDFTAPETIIDPTVRTLAADVYSLGCCLYFALTGLPPFPESRAVQKVIGHQSETPTPVRSRNPNVPVTLANVLDRMMRKQPDQRPTDLPALGNELRSAVSLPSVAADLIPIPAADSPSTCVERTPTVQLIEKRSSWKDSTGAIDFDDLGIPTSHSHSESPEWSAVAPPMVETTPSPPLMGGPDLVPTPPSPPPPRVVVPAAPTQSVPPVQGPDSVRSRPLPSPVLIEAVKATDERPTVVVPDPPLFARKSMRKVRSILFWKKPVDAVQISVFGPPQIAPGQRVQFLVYAHLPEAFEGVSTLCRALNVGADLLGTGYIDRPVPRETEVGIHMALANAGVAKSLINISWTGQTLPRTFDVFVQWESPTGVTSGIVSIGIGQERVGAIPIHFVVLPRSA